MSQYIVAQRCDSLKGKIEVPGDKSISHRAVMLAALAQGTSKIDGFLNGSDCLATCAVMQQLGVRVDRMSDTSLQVHGVGRHGFIEPQNVLDCQNSGTTIRLLCGLLAAQRFSSFLTGSEQIRRRPMGRVVEPLRKMGAQIIGRQNGKFAPLAIVSTKQLTGQTHVLNIASAQVKSAILLAGLLADGDTTVVEPAPARDHTERLLCHMGTSVVVDNNKISVSPLERDLNAINIVVPGDMSSAAFLLVAAGIIPESSITIKDVGINSTRTGIIDALKNMGADISIYNIHNVAGEPVADIDVQYCQLKGATFGDNLIVRMIDELPILAVAATQAHGTTVIKNAEELRVKETDRIATTVLELQKMGAHIEATNDGFIVEGPTALKAAHVDSHGDHRLALALSIAGLVASGKTTIANAEVTVDSFPGFVKTLRQIGAHLEERT